MATRMLQRRGTAAEWAASNPVLGDGEIGYVRETGLVKIGDGVTAWNALPNEYIRKSTMDDLYVARSMADALGDLFVGSGPDTIQRLPRGTTGQRLTVQADGSVAWQDLPAVSNPFAVVDAAGDLLVGSGADAVDRLAKGSNGQVLTISAGGAVTWATPTASDTTKVAKTGDTMTGMLRLASTNGVILMGGAAPSVANDVLLYANPTGGELHLQATNLSGYRGLRAGPVYDGGNRVYSASNPPPVSGMTVLATKEIDQGTAGDNTHYAGTSGTTAWHDLNSSHDFTFVAPPSGKITVTMLGYSYFHNGTPPLAWRIVQTEAEGGVRTGRGHYLPDGARKSAATGLTPGATYTIRLVSATGSGLSVGTMSAGGARAIRGLNLVVEG